VTRSRERRDNIALFWNVLNRIPLLREYACGKKSKKNVGGELIDAFGGGQRREALKTTRFRYRL
jgi:hypothetical protein